MYSPFPHKSRRVNDNMTFLLAKKQYRTKSISSLISDAKAALEAPYFGMNMVFKITLTADAMTTVITYLFS